MRLTVHEATRGSPRITIALSEVVRDLIEKGHGLPANPGYAVQVRASRDRSPRNLIVLKMKKNDPLLNDRSAARIDWVSRQRLAIEPGDGCDVRPLRYETWYHGTRISDPMIIKREGWIVGPGAAMGPGVYLTKRKSIAMQYALSALIECHVAWGAHIRWPRLHGIIKKEFEIWCQEHQLDFNILLKTKSPLGDVNILRWTRLYGHYFSSHMLGIRVFPGPIGSGFKPNRLRIIRIFKRDGRTLIWERGQNN